MQAGSPCTHSMYKILDVDRMASEQEIRQAYKKAALATHPDKKEKGGKEFVEINRAYSILSDRRIRMVYNFFGDPILPVIENSWRRTRILTEFLARKSTTWILCGLFVSGMLGSFLYPYVLLCKHQGLIPNYTLSLVPHTVFVVLLGVLFGLFSVAYPVISRYLGYIFAMAVISMVYLYVLALSIDGTLGDHHHIWSIVIIEGMFITSSIFAPRNVFVSKHAPQSGGSRWYRKLAKPRMIICSGFRVAQQIISGKLITDKIQENIKYYIPALFFGVRALGGKRRRVCTALACLLLVYGGHVWYISTRVLGWKGVILHLISFLIWVLVLWVCAKRIMEAAVQQCVWRTQARGLLCGKSTGLDVQ